MNLRHLNARAPSVTMKKLDILKKKNPNKSRDNTTKPKSRSDGLTHSTNVKAQTSAHS